MNEAIIRIQRLRSNRLTDKTLQNFTAVPILSSKIVMGIYLKECVFTIMVKKIHNSNRMKGIG